MDYDTSHQTLATGRGRLQPGKWGAARAGFPGGPWGFAEGRHCGTVCGSTGSEAVGNNCGRCLVDLTQPQTGVVTISP